MTEDPTRIDLTTDPTTQRMSGVAVHGNTAFDAAFISHIEGNLWQGGTQAGLVLPEGIVHLISLYPWEKYTINHELRSETYVEMYDAFGPVTPDVAAQVDQIAAQVNECVADGPTVVLCQAGLNRSGLVAARSLMLRGWSADDAIALLKDRRSDAVLCNSAFRRWLKDQETA